MSFYPRPARPVFLQALQYQGQRLTILFAIDQGQRLHFNTRREIHG